MKEKLRELGIKTTELSQYMRISRPSLYKYLDSYESREYRNIPDKVLRTFRYIDKYKSLTKEQVITFVICEFAEENTSDKKEAIRKYLLTKGPNDPKIELMYTLISTDFFDGVIHYLNKVSGIMEKEEYSESEIRQISRFVNFRSDIMVNKPLTEEEFVNAKGMLGE